MKNKSIVLVIVVLILTAVVISCRSLTILSTALLIGAVSFAFLRQDDSTDTRKLPWQTWVLAILSLGLYIADWLLGN